MVVILLFCGLDENLRDSFPLQLLLVSGKDGKLKDLTTISLQLLLLSGVEAGEREGREGEGPGGPLQPLHEPDAGGAQRTDPG